MDVYGKNPRSEKGEYFRNNVWWWRPLADFILDVAPPEITGQCEEWHTNSGCGLDAKISAALAEILIRKIESGEAQDYIDARAARIAAMKREACTLCGGTGIRCDEIGKAAGQPNRKIEQEGHPRNGETGWCNGCDGRGDHEPFNPYDHLDVSNIREFAAFLKDCGGFRIC